MQHAFPSETMSVAILYPGDRSVRDIADPSVSRFAPLFEALADAGVKAEPAVYHDDIVAEVEAQLQRARVVLVWHNPCGRAWRLTLPAAVI
jgi:hypothetical protein